MFVEVIVDVKNSNVDKKFFYKIPEEYIEKNLLGYRVEIPFGSRFIQGYVVNVLAKIDFEESRCKFIKSLKDDYPILTKELILLSQVLAEELYCTQIQVIEAMLPTILKNKYLEYYKIEDDSENKSLFSYKKYFSSDGIVLKNKLEKKLSEDQIAYLVGQKLIKLISVNKDQLKDDRIPYLILTNENIENIKVSEKQKVIIDYLYKNKEIKKADVKNVLNIGDSVIKKLVDKNIISIIQREKKINIDTKVYINNNMLNDEQSIAFEKISTAIKNNKFNEYLLHGVTGSGKTEVYIKLAYEAVKEGKNVIILVPEIILTPQIEQKFKKVFGENLAVIHSNLNKSEKYAEWKKIKEKKVNICLGTRSAIFAPFENLGLIIIDEEHESSYKQEETPRYETKNIAKKRAVYNKGTIVYASATPSVDLYYYFEKNKPANIIKLTKRFHNNLPMVSIVSLENKEDIINEELILEIVNTIKRKEQVLLFINKRGYTNYIRCYNCGHIYNCDNCDISLNYHKIDKSLHCHFCGNKKSINKITKCCDNPKLVSGMFGIQKVEEFLQELIPNIRITRMDSDTTSKKGAYEKLLKEFKEQKSDILLGTQMISKGLDFPNITLVGILSVDNLLAYPSFKSNEKLFQLLVQTSGRAGRSENESKVIIQSNVDSEVIDYAINNDYESFYNYEISRRKVINYPPFCKISFINIKGYDETKTQIAAKYIYSFISKHYEDGSILGPTKSVFYKINNEYKYNIAVRFNDNNYAKLHNILKYINAYFKEVYLKDKISISIDNNAQDYI